LFNPAKLSEQLFILLCALPEGYIKIGPPGRIIESEGRIINKTEQLIVVTLIAITSVYNRELGVRENVITRNTSDATYAQ
jgi:hypothetical protein